MSDYILRGELIATIDMTDWYHISNGKLVQGADEVSDALYKAEDVYEAIDSVPAITLRGTAYLVRESDGMFHCSNCRKIPITKFIDKERLIYYSPLLMINYCPTCGAKIKGVQE